MHTLSRILLILAIILPSTGGSLVSPARAAGPIAAGRWTGYFQRDITITNDISGVHIEAHGAGKGDLDLMVDGNGGVTGTVGPYHADISWSASLGGVLGSCTFDTTFEVSSGTVSENPAHLPAFDLKLNTTQYAAQCNPDVGENTAPKTNAVTLDPKTYSGGKITGETTRFASDQFEKVLNSVAQTGAKVNLSEYWELNSNGATVEQITPEYEQYFLAGVPFVNQYTAVIDWRDNPPGKVVFSLAGQNKEAAGDIEVTAAFDLGQVPAGMNPLEVTAITAAGDSSASLAQDVIIVPLEPWAQKANFSVGQKTQKGIQNVVIYQGKTGVPEKPIELPYLKLPDIPVIGGKWGIPPFQVDVNLLADSGGGQSAAAPVTGQAGLFLGGDTPELALKVDGEAVTNLTESALLFDHGQAKFKLAPFTLERKVGLVDLIPAASALYSLPVVGDIIKGANSVLGITLQLTAQADGQAGIAPAADQSQLVFDQGQITPLVKISAKPGLNIPSIISLGVGGGGQGSWTIRIAPNPGLENCSVGLSFTANIAVLNLVNETYTSPPYTVAQCQQASLAGRDVLVVYLPPELSTQIRSAAQPEALQAGTPTPEAPTDTPTTAVPPAAAPLEERNPAVLASGAKPQAELDLALGPQKRMAFAYAGDKSKLGVFVRLFDGKTWGEPIKVSGPRRPDFSPQVAFDSRGRALVAWVQSAPGGPLSGTPPASNGDAARCGCAERAGKLRPLVGDCLRRAGRRRQDPEQRRSHQKPGPGFQPAPGPRLGWQPVAGLAAVALRQPVGAARPAQPAAGFAVGRKRLGQPRNRLQ